MGKLFRRHIEWNRQIQMHSFNDWLTQSNRWRGCHKLYICDIKIPMRVNFFESRLFNKIHFKISKASFVCYSRLIQFSVSSSRNPPKIFNSTRIRKSAWFAVINNIWQIHGEFKFWRRLYLEIFDELCRGLLTL